MDSVESRKTTKFETFMRDNSKKQVILKINLTL